MSSRRRLNIGLVGYAFMGRIHSNAWRQVGRFFPLPFDLHLHTICGRNKSAVDQARDQLGWAHSSYSWQDLVANPEIDIIDISTSNESHAPIAIAAARAGKAILCEKPLATSVEDAEKMLHAAQSSGTTHMLCHNYRRVPALSLARKLISEGALGDRLYHFHARYAQDWLSSASFPISWRLQKDRAGSGAHGDLNAHLIDLAHFLVGPLKEVQAHFKTFVKKRPSALDPKAMELVTVDDSVQMSATFESGTMGTFEATRMASGRKNHLALEINGSEGSLYFNLENMNSLDFYSHSDSPTIRGFRKILVTDPKHPFLESYWPPGHLLGYEHSFVNTVADFLKALDKGTSPTPNFEDGLKIQRVLEAAELSHRERRWVSLNP